MKFRKGPYLFLYDLLGFYPHRVYYYELALCHKSVNKRDASGHRMTNERLEFVGDAVLGAVVADILYKKFIDADEGFLTRTRSKIVCRASLNNIAKQLGLNKYIQKSETITQNVENIYGNALEALMGAIYKDQGYDRCIEFVEKKIVHKGLINIDKVARKEIDFKSKLLEWAQHKQKKVSFNLLDESLLEETNQHIFCYEINVNGVALAKAKGKTKLEAQQYAADLALRQLEKEK